MLKKSKYPKEDKGQPTLFDFGLDLLSEDEKTELNKQIVDHQIQHVSHENHIEYSDKFKEEENLTNLRSEQIIISKDNYPSIRTSDNKYQFYQSIDNISNSCHKSKNIFNQCLYQIRLSFFNKIDLNLNKIDLNLNKIDLNLNNLNLEKERHLRIDIKKELDKCKNYSFEKLKKSNYKNQVYKLLDKYFRSEKNSYYDNYSWSPQASQQIIDMCVEAWLDNDLGRRDYDQHPEHRKDYTGRPNITNYRKSLEFVSIFTNQQCKIEKKDTVKNTNDLNIKWLIKHFLTFPDHLNIRPIEVNKYRLSDKTDLREVRIIPLIRKGYYKIELVYKKVLDKIKIKNLNLDPNRIIGIDTGQENVVTIAKQYSANRRLLSKGGILLSINQWFDKLGSKLYEIYYRQQKHEKGKKDPIKMVEKMKKLSFDRTNFVLDILHKISRSIINYCISHRIGCIVWGRNPGWKQFLNLGKRTNQKFTKIPHYLLFKLLKYKAEEIGIKVIDIEESHTSKCSFLDKEEICHHAKYVGKRIKRGLFRSLKGIILNADVNAAYNMIRKVFPDAFAQFIKNGELMLKSVGIVTPKGEGVVLHPLRLSVSDLFRGPNLQIGHVGVNSKTKSD